MLLTGCEKDIVRGGKRQALLLRVLLFGNLSIRIFVLSLPLLKLKHLYE